MNDVAVRLLVEDPLAYDEKFGGTFVPAVWKFAWDALASFDEFLCLADDRIVILGDSEFISGLLLDVVTCCGVVISVVHAEQNPGELFVIVLGFFVVFATKTTHGIRVGVDATLFIDQLELVCIKFD